MAASRCTVNGHVGQGLTSEDRRALSALFWSHITRNGMRRAIDRN